MRGAAFVTTDGELAERCRRWSASGLVGVDTEFVRERTYHPRPGLVQVIDATGVALVDPLVVSDFAPLAALLADPAVVTVMHAPGEDLDLFEVLLGTAPRGLFDTQRAAALAGYGLGLGYGALVSALLDVELEKGETRSDWLARPLTPSQARYAVLDVAHLLPLHDRLSRALVARGRTAWLDEEMAHLARTRERDRDPDRAYLRVKGRGALPPVRHRRLRALAAWREREAVRRDMPRRHLLPDTALLALSAVDPERPLLTGVRGLSAAARARYGDALLACLQAIRGDAPGPLDQSVDLRPHADRLDRMKQLVAAAAARSGVPAELLASRRMLEATLIRVLVEGGDLPPELTGWRYDLVGRQLIDVLHADPGGRDRPRGRGLQ